MHGQQNIKKKKESYVSCVETVVTLYKMADTWWLLLGL